MFEGVVDFIAEGHGVDGSKIRAANCQPVKVGMTNIYIDISGAKCPFQVLTRGFRGNHQHHIYS